MNIFVLNTKQKNVSIRLHQLNADTEFSLIVTCEFKKYNYINTIVKKSSIKSRVSEALPEALPEAVEAVVFTWKRKRLSSNGSGIGSGYKSYQGQGCKMSAHARTLCADSFSNFRKNGKPFKN